MMRDRTRQDLAFDRLRQVLAKHRGSFDRGAVFGRGFALGILFGCLLTIYLAARGCR